MKRFMGEKEVVPFKDIKGNEDFKLPLISKMVGKDLVIAGVRFNEGYFGTYAVVTLKNKKEYRTSSLVLIEQLQKIEEYLNDGKLVSATLEESAGEKGAYYTFT